MDFTTLNRAQLLLKVAAVMEKRAAGGEVSKGLLDAAKRIISHGATSVKDVAKAGFSGFRAGAEALEHDKHPVLALAMRAAPYAGLGAAGLHGAHKLQQWQLQRAYRRQMGS